MTYATQKQWAHRAAASAFLLGTCAAVWAQEGGEAKGAEGGGSVMTVLGVSLFTIVAQLFAFLLLYILFRKFLWGPILGLLASRQHEVSTLYSDAETARAAAETSRSEYETRLAKADEESRERIATALAQANAMKDEIINSAREQADRIITNGREDVRREIEKGQVTIRDTSARMAVELAGKIIKQNMNADVQNQLVNDFIANAGSDSGAAGAAGRAQ